LYIACRRAHAVKGGRRLGSNSIDCIVRTLYHVIHGAVSTLSSFVSFQRSGTAHRCRAANGSAISGFRGSGFHLSSLVSVVDHMQQSLFLSAEWHETEVRGAREADVTVRVVNRDGAALS
jgi:hypothetical protein